MPAIPRDVDSGTPEAGTSGTPAPDDHKHVLANLGVENVKIANGTCHLRIKSAPFFKDLKFKSAPPAAVI